MFQVSWQSPSFCEGSFAEPILINTRMETSGFPSTGRNSDVILPGLILPHEASQAEAGITRRPKRLIFIRPLISPVLPTA